VGIASNAPLMLKKKYWGKSIGRIL